MKQKKQKQQKTTNQTQQKTMLFQLLPNDTINIIFDFYGKIKYIKGKYINIIHKNDNRYDILAKK